ncbi:large conductance mechanosensitive channel protein MscL [Kineococcus rubinsiae]|uniref:large conductance mechanosensitive channel protein MscL n=1 Tax=Kineococcus rubinsiae TaxID=2609562 RepID=UPI00143061D3|nr:large conductance mechanosensitive channel protein MscL [Kineococcus rubinsiae]NIZ90760.1 large conductance mechanosensitive channel protein MscL [Kineococcus rubinsiae]
MPLITGFKNFVLRGNVIDLAVAVVIGTAFAAVVKALVDSFINPLVAAVVGGSTLATSMKIPLRGDAAIEFGAILAAILNFVIVAAVVYFLVVVPMNRLLALRKQGEVAEPAAPAEDVLLLTEIRDLLAAQNGTATATSRP